MSLSVDDLIAYFRAGAKPRAQFRIGIEQEKLGTRLDGAPVGYGGPNGIEDVLLRLEQREYTATRSGILVAAANDCGIVTGYLAPACYGDNSRVVTLTIKRIS